MEVVLLITVLVLVIVILKKVNSRFQKMQDAIFSLHEKVNQLNRNLSTEEKTVSPPIIKEVIPEKKDTKPPIVVSDTKEEPILKTIIKEETILTVSEKIPEIVQKPITPRKAAVPKKSFLTKFKENNPDLEKFIGENLINKIGILILVLGISFFVKYAIDKDWINEPARVGIGILCGALVMAIAHKLKKNYSAFSSVLVAGAISIFYFTIAIAFHEYQLFGQTVAFTIMVAITAFSALVSISYNRQELAVLTLIGGFAVPFMISTGESNHLVLFTYIAILNIGILAIAYFKKWRVVTILAFAFTSLLFGTWIVQEINAGQLPHLAALLFGTLFYFIFSIAIVLNNLRNKGVFSTVEYFILVANTFFFFSIGIATLHDWNSDLKGAFTLLLAMYNVGYAAILYKRFGLDKNAIYLLIGLALTFVTLTIPIQFEGNLITLFWSAEAVLLFWLSQKTKINYFKIGAVVVQILAVISLVMDWDTYRLVQLPLNIILNPIFISGLAVCVSLALSYLILRKEDKVVPLLKLKFNPSLYRESLLIVFAIVAYLTGIQEVGHQAYGRLFNPYSALSFNIVYHFVFSATLLFLASTYKIKILEKAVTVIWAFSILLYMVYFYNLPTKEMVENMVMGSNSQYAFYFHYIVLLSIFYFLYQLWKMANSSPRINILNLKIAPWIFAFVIVYVLSNEVMLHGLRFSTGSIDQIALTDAMAISENSGDTYPFEAYRLLESSLHDLKLQIIKIGYPILWGIFSFVFLIIGIRRQWKSLRIIALSLLGLTILKLFIYDINNVSETGKILAFILLGVLILIISFVYQKIKRLVVNDTPSPSDEE